MNIKLKYGSGQINLTLPDRQVMGIYRPQEKRGVRNLDKAVRRSLARPIGTKQLRQMVRPSYKIAVVVDDATRSVPSCGLLVPVVDELNEAGVPDKNICVLVATGLHRKMKRDELDMVLGPLKGRIKIINHDSNKNLRFLGKTRLGTRIFLNRIFMDADIKILTGDVEFHQFCGYGGGAKSVYPGLADSKSICLSHSRMELKGTGPGRVEGNPVRKEIDEAGRMAGVDFIVNVVLNSRKGVVKIFSGDMYEAFLAGTRACDQMYCAEVSSRADVVIASAGGFPKDIELYQAQKAIESARRITKKRGKVILLAECREGHGSELAYRWAKEAKSVDDIIQRLKKKFVMGGHKAYQLARTVKWADVYILSSLKTEVVREFFMHPLSSVDEIYALLREDDKIVVLPQATLTLTRLRNASEATGFLD